MKHTKLMLQYSGLQGVYWMMFCSIYSFATVFLLERGFSETYIGLVLALGNILGVILQPTVASLADRSQKITVHRLTASLAAGMLAVLALLYLMPGHILWTAALFILADALLQVLQPLVNSVSVYYTNRGVEVNFGAARGFGSVMFAVASSVLGILIADFGSSVILLFGSAALCVIMLLCTVMPVLRESWDAMDRDNTQQKREATSGRNAVEFFRRYRYFSITLMGLTLLLMNHNMLNNYMFQIVEMVGGDSASMGKAMSIAAFMELPTMFFFSQIVRKISSRRLLMVSGGFFLAKSLFSLFCHSMGQLYMIQLLQMGGFALYIPASVYYVNEVMEEQDKFKGQALAAGTSTLGGVFGGLLGGAVLEHWGTRPMIFLSAIAGLAGMLLVVFFAAKRDSERIQA